MKFSGIFLIILAQSLLFAIAPLHPILVWGSIGLIGLEIILLILAKVECLRESRSDVPVILGAIALAITLLIGG